jgi:hypothetical protein
MPKYLPLEIGIKIKTSISGMIDLRWRRGSLVADFLIPGDDLNVIRVQFDKALIVRILDEMPLSTEFEPTPNEGLVSEHFAYRVEGAQFWKMQSEALRATSRNAEHYRFTTGWDCLDVIAASAPVITVERAEGS